MLVTPEPAGATESRLYLVEDEEDAVSVGALPQALQEARRGGQVAAVTENRLDEEGRGVGGRDARLQQVVQFTECEVDRGVGVPAVAVGVGERCHVHAAHQRGEARGEARPGGGQAGRRDSAAVEAALEHDDVGLRGGHPGETDGGLHGFGTGVRVEDGVEANGQYRPESGGELEERGVHHGGVLRVDDLGALSLRGRDDVRVAVAGTGYADTGGEVEVVATVGAPDPRTGRGVDDDGSRLFQGGAQRRGLVGAELGTVDLGLDAGSHGYTVTPDRTIVNN